MLSCVSCLSAHIHQLSPYHRLSSKVQTLCSNIKAALGAVKLIWVIVKHHRWAWIPHFQVLGCTDDEIWILPFSCLSVNDLKWDSSLVILKSIQKMGFEQVWFFFSPFLSNKFNLELEKYHMHFNLHVSFYFALLTSVCSFLLKTFAFDSLIAQVAYNNKDYLHLVQQRWM